MRGYFVKIFTILFVLAPSLAQAETYSIATGNPSGTYYPYGGGLASLWSKGMKGFNMKAEVTGASVTNIIQLAKGESEAAITQADVAMDATNGTGKFNNNPLPVSMLMSLYPNLVHLVTASDSDVHSINDIRGKVISIGAPGSGNATATLKILDALGIAESEFTVRNLNYTETATSLKDGHIDAGFIVGGIGLAAMIELALTRDIRLVPFRDEEIATLNTKYPAFTAFEVPSGVYQGVDQPVQTASLWNVLMVQNALEEETAYQMVKLAFAKKEVLQQVASVARYTTPENAVNQTRLPYHPGAIRYYEEAGLWQNRETHAASAHPHFTIRDKDGAPLFQTALAEGTPITLNYIHSTENIPITEHFERRGEKLWLVKSESEQHGIGHMPPFHSQPTPMEELRLYTGTEATPNMVMTIGQERIALSQKWPETHLIFAIHQ